MRRITSIVLLLMLMMASLCLQASAENSSAEVDEHIWERSLVLAINDQLSEDEKVILNTVLTINEQGSYEVPVIRVYLTASWHQMGLPFDEFLSDVKAIEAEVGYNDYLVLDTTPYIVRIRWNDDRSIKSVTKEQFPDPVYTQVVADLMALTWMIVSENGIFIIEDVYCFDVPGGDGAAVYFKTNRGIYVKYYDTASSIDGPYPADATFTETEFRSLSQGFRKFISEKSTNEEGKQLYGKICFFTYLQTISDNDPPSADIGEDPSEPDSNAGIYYIVAAATALVIVAGTVTFVVIRKRRRVRKELNESDIA